MDAGPPEVAPFHAVAALDVHHNHDDCKTGNFIERWNRVAGDGGLPLCMECAALGYVAPSERTMALELGASGRTCRSSSP